MSSMFQIWVTTSLASTWHCIEIWSWLHLGRMATWFTLTRWGYFLNIKLQLLTATCLRVSCSELEQQLCWPPQQGVRSWLTMHMRSLVIFWKHSRARQPNIMTRDLHMERCHPARIERQERANRRMWWRNWTMPLPRCGESISLLTLHRLKGKTMKTRGTAVCFGFWLFMSIATWSFPGLSIRSLNCPEWWGILLRSARDIT